MELALLLSFALYLMVLLAIGLISTYRAQPHVSENQSAFLLGGRSLNYWVTAISAHAADMSDWLLMGFPAALYMHGMPSFWIAIGLIVGMFLTWHFIAPKLRITTEQYDAYTLTTYFERRFHDHSGTIRILTTIIITFFFTIYLAAGVKGVGLLLKTVFDIPYHLGGLLAIAIVIGYTIVGGYIAAGWTELFQGIFLLIMLLITPAVAFIRTGGLATIITAAQEKHISLSLLPDYSFTTLLSLLLGPCAWGLGYFGMPHILIKFCGTKNVSDMYKSKYIGMTWQILAFVAAASVGIVGISYFATPLANPESIFIIMAQTLFPSFIAGFILCAILAATLSTMDAQILVLAGIVAHDLYKTTVNKQATSRQMLLVYRLAIVVISLVAYVIAFNEQSTIFGLVQYAWSGLGASFGPLVILSLYSTRINRYGALAGIVAGGLTSAVWKYLHITFVGHPINEILPGFILGLIVIAGISELTSATKK